MLGYQVRKIDIEIGAFKGEIRALRDLQQFSDPKGTAAQAGICSASWSMFGNLWPASRVLAEQVKKMPLQGRSVIELGCGLALPSLILQAQGVEVTASDHHPLSADFLHYNANLNQLETPPFINLAWQNPDLNLPTFDVIIGSDILYEPNHAKLLAQLINRLANPQAKVLITCPGRGHRNNFSRKMQHLGFQLTEKRLAFEQDETAPFKGRLLTYKRGF